MKDKLSQIFSYLPGELSGTQCRHVKNTFLAALLLAMILCPTSAYAQISWLVQISDTHLGQSKSYEPQDKALWIDAVSAIVCDCNDVIRPIVVINTGDLVSIGRDENYAVYREAVSSLHAPLLNCPGNHEYEIDTTTFPRCIGPSHQQQLVGDLYFVCMNTRSFMGAGNPATEISWLTAVLATQAAQSARIRIVCGHYPLYTDEDRHIGGVHLRKDFQVMGSNRETFIRTLRIGQADLYLSGHVHANWDQVCLVSGTHHLVTDCTENGTYRVIVVDGTNIGTRLTTTNEWPLVVVTQPTAYVNGSSAISRGVVKVRAKVFAKNEVKNVTCITEGDHAKSLKLGDDGMWEVELNTTEMKPGLHKLAVEAIDAENKNSISEINFVVHK